jgi:hypothetical protein
VIRGWLLVVALCLPGAVAAQDGGREGWQTFELPSQAFGDDADLGKYNYLGKLQIPEHTQLPEHYQLPGMGPYVLDNEMLKKLICPDGTCIYRTPGLGAYVSAPSVAEDEIRLDNPQPIALGLRLTVGGVPGLVSIKATESYSRKLVAGTTAVAEIASGSTVTTTSLQPGKAYTIQVVNGAYFIVPNN